METEKKLTKTEKKHEFIRLRAEGVPFSQITPHLHISKSTCSAWERELEEEVRKLKQSELNALYEAYGMKKQARIKALGETLGKVENALQKADFSKVSPDKLLDYKLKYTEALQKEYTGLEPGYKIHKEMKAQDIVEALGDLLNRVRAGEVSKEQADKEITVLANLLKAYDAVELQGKLNQLEAILEMRSN